MTFDDAAALPIAYGSAWRMLVTRGGIRPMERVLILGAAGGVGTACVQIAKLAGCVVYAAASREDKLAKLAALGADHLINYREVEFDREVWRLTKKRGVDVVVDYTGADTWPRSIRSLRKGGRLLVCGATSGYEAKTDLRYVWTRELSVLGSDGWSRADLEAVLRAAQSGQDPPGDRPPPAARRHRGGTSACWKSVTCSARSSFGRRSSRGAHRRPVAMQTSPDELRRTDLRADARVPRAAGRDPRMGSP